MSELHLVNRLQHVQGLKTIAGQWSQYFEMRIGQHSYTTLGREKTYQQQLPAKSGKWPHLKK